MCYLYGTSSLFLVLKDTFATQKESIFLIFALHISELAVSGVVPQSNCLEEQMRSGPVVEL